MFSRSPSQQRRQGKKTTDEDLKIKDKYEQKVEDARKEYERAKIKAKKSRKKAKDYYRSLYAQGYTREDIIESQDEVNLKKGRNKNKSKKIMNLLIEMLDEIDREDQEK